MKLRHCDSCGKEIENRKDYYKVSFQEHKEKKQILTHTADLCVACYNRIVKKKDVKNI